MRVLFRLLLCFFITFSFADNKQISSIEYNGLHRLTKDTLSPWIDLSVGDQATDEAISRQIKKFYESQYFESIASQYSDGKLSFTFIEEPIISSISFEGNNTIGDKELDKMAQSIGIKIGRPLNPTKLKHFIYSISEEYKSKGYSNVDIKPELKKSIGKVRINVVVEENKQSTYGSINIKGNKLYSDGTLEWAIGMQRFGLLSWLGGTYIYSEANFDQSIAMLYEYYYDRGYLEFDVLKKDVELDSKTSYANVNIELYEGDQYIVKSLKIDSPVQLPKSIAIMQEAIEHQPFSKKELMKLMQSIQAYLKDIGYAYATVIPEQTIDSKKNEVRIKLNIKPEKVYHIRKINFHGNDLSNSTMIRRYLKQNEGQRFSQKELDASKNRLLGLEYFEDVNYKINPVPGFSDQVDIDYDLSEKDSVNSIMGEVGWGKSAGLTLGADLKFKNFFGTGNQVILGVKSTKTALTASLSHQDPFFTDYGISRSTKLYYSAIDTDHAKATDYKANNVGLSMVYGIPATRYSKIDVGFNIEQTEFKDRDDYSQQVQNFINDHGNSYTNFALKLGLGHARYEKNYQNKFNASLEVGLPVFPHEITYYTANITDRYRVDLYELNPKEKFKLELSPKVSYGQGYDAFSGELPFFKRFHAGGFGTVRNYHGYSLGPKDSKGDAIGGDLLTVFSTNLYFPTPFIENNPFETALFVDVGNVFENHFDADDLRGSYGLMVLLRMGQLPIGFTFAKAFNDKAGDDFNEIDFAFGMDF